MRSTQFSEINPKIYPGVTHIVAKEPPEVKLVVVVHPPLQYNNYIAHTKRLWYLSPHIVFTISGMHGEK